MQFTCIFVILRIDETHTDTHIDTHIDTQTQTHTWTHRHTATHRHTHRHRITCRVATCRQAPGHWPTQKCSLSCR